MGDSCSFSFKDTEPKTVVDGYTEAEVEKMRERSWLIGIAVGHERDAAFLMKEAKEFFAADKDDMAKTLRSLSEKLTALAQDARYDAKKFE